MWYFLSIIVSCLGMYLILAHKDRELRGAEPHHVIHKLRESSNRMLSGMWRRVCYVSAHIVAGIARYTIVIGRFIARASVLIARDIARVAVWTWYGLKRGIHALADKVAHPHVRHHVIHGHRKS